MPTIDYEYECPNCHGTMHWNENLQQMECDYCHHTYDIEELQTKAYDGAEQTDNDSDVYIYQCTNCKGEVLSNTPKATFVCPNCQGQMAKMGKQLGTFLPTHIAPFRINKEDAIKQYKRYIRKKILIPKEFQNKEHMEDMQAIYLPYWLYSAAADFSVTYDCTNEAKSEKNHVKYLETAHYKATRHTTADFVRIPSDASKNLPPHLTETIGAFDNSTLVPVDREYRADCYEMNAEETLGYAKDRMSNTILQETDKTVKQYKTHNIAKQTLILNNLQAEHVLYPAYILQTQIKTLFGKRNYVFLANGQTGQCVGNFPVGTDKMFLFFFIFTAIYAFIINLILSDKRGINMYYFPMSLGISAALALISVVLLVFFMRPIKYKGKKVIKDAPMDKIVRADKYSRSQKTRVAVKLEQAKEKTISLLPEIEKDKKTTQSFDDDI